MLAKGRDLLSDRFAEEALPWSAGPTRLEEQGSQPAFRSAMFIGSINADLRSILVGLAHAWRGQPVYVGCSGNFTVERILAAQELTDLHSNDVSLSFCALGTHLTVQPFRVEIVFNENNSLPAIVRKHYAPRGSPQQALQESVVRYRSPQPTRELLPR